MKKRKISVRLKIIIPNRTCRCGQGFGRVGDIFQKGIES